MNTIQQIQDTVNTLQEKRIEMSEKQERYFFDMRLLECEISKLQTHLDMLAHDLSYDHQLEMFMSGRA